MTCVAHAPPGRFRLTRAPRVVMLLRSRGDHVGMAAYPYDSEEGPGAGRSLLLFLGRHEAPGVWSRAGGRWWRHLQGRLRPVIEGVGGPGDPAPDRRIVGVGGDLRPA